MARKELFISIDIETDGPAPGLNSMLALGAAAFDQEGEQVGWWYATLEPLEDACADDGTMQWWLTQREAWAEVNKDRQHPARAIPEFADWCEIKSADHGGAKLVAVGWPIAFDFAYVNYYCHRFAGRNPLGFGGGDIRSYANGLAGHSDYYGLKEEQVRTLAGEIDKTGLRPHVAVDDAIEQGRLFVALRKYALAAKVGRG